MRRSVTVILALAWFAACTTAPSSTLAPPTSEPSSSPPASPEPEGPVALVDAASLTSCDPAAPTRRQTVAFVTGGAAWAVDPKTGALTCLFEVGKPGPFAWGPLGDRVVLAKGEVVANDGASIGTAVGMHDPASWSRPTGRSLVYVIPGSTTPTKFTIDGGALTDLRDLPAGTYESIAYHPSGLAMAVGVRNGDEPQIHLATNEGVRSERVIVGISALSFPALGFDQTGENLFYAAEHKGGYIQLHRLTLSPNALQDGWRSEAPLGQVASWFVGPGPTPQIAITASGEDCSSSIAMLGDTEVQEAALPSVDGPTHALGFIDDQRLIVGAGGCGEPMDLYAVGRGPDKLIVEGVRMGASRAAGRPEPAAPIDPGLLAELEEFG